MVIFLAASEIAHRSLTSAFSDSEMRRASPKSPFSTAGTGLALCTTLCCFYWKLFMAKIRHLVQPVLKIPDPNSWPHGKEQATWAVLDWIRVVLTGSFKEYLDAACPAGRRSGLSAQLCWTPQFSQGDASPAWLCVSGKGVCSVAYLAGRLFASKCGARGCKTSSLSSWLLAQLS